MKNFRQMVLIFFLALKTGPGSSCIIYKIPVKFSLSFDMKPGTGVIQTNGTENFGRKNGKKGIPRKEFLSFRKISTGMNRSIQILPRIPDFSYKW